MSFSRIALLSIVILASVLTAPGFGQEGSAEKMTSVTAGTIKWADLSVPGFDPGLKVAVLAGNPDATTGAYTLRLAFPAGYRFPPHWHPNAENLTVVSGTFLLAMGETVNDSQLKTYGVGDYLYLPGKHPHYGGVKGATVIQLHGNAPFTINLVKPVK
jgi:quercetin dioxygenase-like cupin family protein